MTAECADELREQIREHYGSHPDMQRQPRAHAGRGDCWCGNFHSGESSSV
jgi:hypothetical protein